MITFDAAAYANPDEAISLRMFGAEHLGGEAISRVMTNLLSVGVTHLRWPGGIPAEDMTDGTGGYVYDLTSPDIMTWQRNGGTAATFGDVLGHVVGNSMSLSMLAPTARYVREMHDNSLTAPSQAAYDDMYAYLMRLHSFDPNTGLNAFGATAQQLPDLTIEIGSEYYATDQWNAAVAAGMDPADVARDFGLVFAQIGRAIEDFETSNGVEINAAVQAARFQSNNDFGNAADNQIFIDAFQAAGALDVIDSIIWHRYTDTFDQTEHGVTDQINGTDLATILGAWETATGNPDLDLVAGWLGPDVRSQSELNQQGDNPFWGAKSLTSILQQFAVLSGAGMDMGTIYALGSNGNFGTLSLRDDIFIGGQLYQLMIEELPGTFVHDGYQENSFVGLNGGDGYNEYHFSNEYKVVSFIAAKDLDMSSGPVSASLTYSEGLVDGSAVRLFDPGAIDVISSATNSAVGVVGSIETVSLGWTGANDAVSFSFEHDYEVVRLVMYRADVLIDETFSMAEHSQQIRTLTLQGDDHIDGLGNDGANVLNGNSGNNLLSGGRGDDVLFGGQGNDELVGGAGRDEIWGGAGADCFIFKTGEMTGGVVANSTDPASLAGLDVVQDFQVGVDTLEFQGESGLLAGKDLTVWEVDIAGDRHFAVQVVATQETVLVNVEEHVSLAEINNPSNFLSDVVVCEMPLPDIL